MVEPHVGHWTNAYVSQSLPAREALQPLSPKYARPGRACLKEKEIVVAKNGAREPPIAPLGGLRVEIVLKQIPIEEGRCAAQRGRDAARGGPVGLRRDFTKLPTQMGSCCVCRIEKEEEMLILSPSRHLSRWRQGQCERRDILDSGTVDDTQRRNHRLDRSFSGHI
jgi:hypothetical protein